MSHDFFNVYKIESITKLIFYCSVTWVTLRKLSATLKDLISAWEIALFLQSPDIYSPKIHRKASSSMNCTKHHKFLVKLNVLILYLRKKVNQYL